MQDLPSLLSVTHSISNDTLSNGYHDPSFSLHSSEHEPLLSLPLPQAYLTNKQPALTVNTSPGAPKDVSAVDKSLERADEELISPFSWHSDSIQSSQWSPELAYHPVAPERPDNTTVQDGLDAALGIRAMVDAQYAPLYQERPNSMPNTQMLYGGATFVSPGQATDFSELSYEAGKATSDPGNQGGLPDSIFAEGGVEFNWAGATGIPPASSLEVQQYVSASSVDSQEWLGQLEGSDIVGYESECFMTDTIHPKEYGSQASADEVPQSLPLQAVPLSASPTLEGLLTECQEAQTNGHGDSIANTAAIQPTQDYPHHSDTPLNRSFMPAPASASKAEPISLQALARYQHASPVGGRIAKRRKPFRDPQKRVATGETRRRGACARCWKQRIRVS